MHRYLVSFPRSGQHLTERLLEKICKASGVPYSYCKFYGCCQKSPCAKGKLVQKNHDFDLKLANNPSDRYVVLYRSDPVEALEAHWRYDQIQPSQRQNNAPSRTFVYRPEKLQSCIEFCRARVERYRQFCGKWTLPATNTLVVDYHDLVTQPLETTIKILGHLFPGQQFAPQVIAKAVANEAIAQRNQIPPEWYAAISKALA